MDKKMFSSRTHILWSHTSVHTSVIPRVPYCCTAREIKKNEHRCEEKTGEVRVFGYLVHVRATYCCERPTTAWLRCLRLRDITLLNIYQVSGILLHHRADFVDRPTTTLDRGVCGFEVSTNKGNHRVDVILRIVIDSPRTWYTPVHRGPAT